jgi:asparagine synthase (glutamine-hydrolysing)
MHFSSTKLGESVGVIVETPFLDEEFMTFAKSINAVEKVGEHAGKKFGKFLLRKCFEPKLGNLVWRQKLAQEQGAATDRYQTYVEETIDDLNFANRVKLAKDNDGVRIRSKEHLHYYLIFRSYYPPPQEDDCVLRCSDCLGCMEEGRRFCRTCGAFPVTAKSL